MAKKSTVKKSEPLEVQIPIKWNIPDTCITRFASNMVVQQMEDYFKLSFFEIKPEINLTAPETPITETNADCVASVIVTPTKLVAIVGVLQQQLEMFREKLKANLVAPIEPGKPS